MAEQLYYTLVTDYGLGAMQNASFLNQKVELTHLAIGDGAGSLYEPQGSQKALKNEVYRGQLNHVYVDPDNPAMMVFECVIPQTSGGYTIREAGLFDADGNCFAIAKVAETVKPKLEEGAAKELYIRLILELSNTEAITIKIDPSIVLATQKWVSELFTPIEHISDFNNPHGVTAEQVGAWSKDENKRVAYHHLSMGGRVEIKISKTDSGEYKERAVYGTLAISPKFNKSKLFFAGTWTATLSGDDGSVVYGGLVIYHDAAWVREAQVFINTTQSAMAGDYAGMKVLSSIPFFSKSAEGALELKVNIKAGKAGGLSTGQDAIIVVNDINWLVIEQEI